MVFDSMLRMMGLSPPPNFPDSELHVLHRTVTTRISGDQVLPQYLSAVSAVSLRYVSAVDLDREWAGLLRRDGDAPPPPGRYLQERALFGFFSAAFSLFESFGYMAHSIAATVDPTAFPLSPAAQASISFRSTASGYGSRFPTEAVSGEMHGVATAPEYRRLLDLRNLLSHRSAPGRLVKIGAGGVEPTDWKLSIHGMQNAAISPAITSDLLGWIDGVLPPLMKGIREFAERNVPVTT